MTAAATSANLVPALAQSTERPGWFGRQAPRDQSTRDQAQRESASHENDAAARLYADARAALETGDTATAQRRLEWLVAQYPQSPLADVARRDLQKLYTTTFAAPSAPPLSTAGIVGLTSGTAIERAGSSVLGQSPAAPPLAELQLAMDDLRQKAGDRIFFAAENADLPARAHAALQAQADWLQRNPSVAVILEGHADDRGNAEENFQLSRRRAEAIRLRLADLGVEASRLTVVAYGRDRPVAECAAASCAAQNRRVVTVVTRAPSPVGAEAARRGLQN